MPNFVQSFLDRKMFGCLHTKARLFDGWCATADLEARRSGIDRSLCSMIVLAIEMPDPGQCCHLQPDLAHVQ